MNSVNIVIDYSGQESDYYVIDINLAIRLGSAIPKGRHSETAPLQGALTPEAQLTPTYCNHDKTVRQTVFISIQFLLCS